MRKLMILALTCSACLSAQAAQWAQYNPRAYMLVPAEDEKMMVLATLKGDAIAINLLDASGSVCEESETSDLTPAGPYRVNGTNVKFIQACLNGSRVLAPESSKGKAFFSNAITSGPATIELDRGVVLHFESEDFESIKKSMLETRSAL